MSRACAGLGNGPTGAAGGPRPRPNDVPKLSQLPVVPFCQVRSDAPRGILVQDLCNACDTNEAHIGARTTQTLGSGLWWDLPQDLGDMKCGQVLLVRAGHY